VRHIYRKLEVRSRGEAVYEALALGLVKVEE
jgi:DNA-binding CsgD family transcriptional regulator